MGEDDADSAVWGYNPVYGEKVERGCTDCFVMLIFLAFLGGMVVIAGLGFQQGDPQRLISGLDSEWDLCGRDNAPFKRDITKDGHTYTTGGKDLTDKHYLYYDKPPHSALCVETCPDGQGTITDLGGIPVPTYETVKLVKFCMPSPEVMANLAETTMVMGGSNITAEGMAAVTKMMSSESMTDAVADIMTAKHVILLSILLAFIMGFAWVYLLHLFADLLVMVLVVGIAVGMGFGSFNLFQRGTEMATAAAVSKNQNSIDQANNMLYVSYAAFAVTGLYIIMMLCMIKQIYTAVGIIKEAGRALADLPYLVLFPCFPVVLTTLFLLYWFVVAFYLASAGELSAGTAGFATLEYNDTLKGCAWYHLFGLFWVTNFFSHLSAATIACVACYWYWAPNKETGIQPNALGSSLDLMCRHHLGSIAFGSLVVALVQLVRWIFDYFEHYLKENGAEKSNFVRCVRYCVDYCLRCFEKCLKFLSKQAYIQMCLTGKSFCAAGYDALMLMITRAASVASVQTIGDSFLFLGKFFVAIATAGIVGVILTRTEYYRDSIHSPLAPGLLAFVLAYMVGAMFMGVYESVIDTLFQCYVMDEKQNKDCMYASEELREYVGGLGVEDQKKAEPEGAEKL